MNLNIFLNWQGVLFKFVTYFMKILMSLNSVHVLYFVDKKRTSQAADRGKGRCNVAGAEPHEDMLLQ
jgi:hypothetical protein